MTASKKLTPGGHWLMIAQQFCKKEKRSAARSAEVYFMTSAALFDGFIACWKTKYETHRIRPETVIQADLDKDWQPYLQTPPFPEYPSGHSTISAASAEVLTAFFGDNVPFTDSTELIFGHGIGHFPSFRAAAAEASVSRVYGGIHFQSGCDAGAGLGRQVGVAVVGKLRN
jgi:membrane-associated phospholipid phosphatase